MRREDTQEGKGSGEEGRGASAVLLPRAVLPSAAAGLGWGSPGCSPVCPALLPTAASPGPRALKQSRPHQAGSRVTQMETEAQPRAAVQHRGAARS